MYFIIHNFGFGRDYYNTKEELFYRNFSEFLYYPENIRVYTSHDHQRVDLIVDEFNAWNKKRIQTFLRGKAKKYKFRRGPVPGISSKYYKFCGRSPSGRKQQLREFHRPSKKGFLVEWDFPRNDWRDRSWKRNRSHQYKIKKLQTS